MSGGVCSDEIHMIIHRFYFVIVDTPADTVRELQQELEGQDFCVWETSLGGSGVLCHLSTDSQVYTVPSRLT